MALRTVPEAEALRSKVHVVDVTASASPLAPLTLQFTCYPGFGPLQPWSLSQAPVRISQIAIIPNTSVILVRRSPIPPFLLCGYCHYYAQHATPLLPQLPKYKEVHDVSQVRYVQSESR